jgi:hypothetical protein
MKIPDINLLIYAIKGDTPHHEKAKSWLEHTLCSQETVGFAWIVLSGFLRITTNDRIMPKPLPLTTATEVIDDWLSLPVAQTISPTENHWDIVKELLMPLGTAGNLTSDAHLAALAIEHGGRLCSTDNDFSRFRLLRWTNPLEE